THPNIAIIGEEVHAANKTIADVTKDICDVICLRAKEGKNYGVVLIPEGLIEFIPEFGILIKELNEVVDRISDEEDRIAAVINLLPENLKECFTSLPRTIQEQLLFDRDPHGNVQVSRIETEKLLIATVTTELSKRKEAGKYVGKFSPQNNFFGYEGRAALPSNFDSDYCYALGYNASALIAHGFSGYMSCIQALNKPVEEWKALGIPITMMMNIEKRHGQSKAVIKKALVDLEGDLFATFKAESKKWATNDDYRYPGPIQFFGDPEITDNITLTLEHIS
ncbi:MAG: diphosphate--fructose-6-phosphate 1-phosphotransferase, partial [Waddliaceae bacterium]|nr:diphosphate--fructose-6-phosphate 1-phosphotransferase [Waddliaceae bacterium]